MAIPPGRHPTTTRQTPLANEREQAELQRHIQGAVERAAARGHRLALWRRVTQPGLFVRETTCTRCGEKVLAGYTTLLVAFAHDCPGNE